jgi:starch synthase
MRICQSTWVRFHHFDLARELHAMGHLERIFTSLPPWRAKREDVSNDKISCNFIMEGIRRIVHRVPGYSHKWDAHLATLHTQSYSQWVARNLPECDVFMGISGSGLHAGRKIQSRGGIYICDRGSTHARHQNDLLEREFKRWGMNFRRDCDFLIENEEAEYETADIITVPAKFAKRSFVAMGIPVEKIRVAPYGVNLTEFQPVGSPPSDGTFRVLFVGQVSIRKGIPYLLEAFARFNHPKKELIVVGEMTEEIRFLVAKLPTSQVQFVGPVSRTEVKNYMSTSHVLVLPSLEEGLALVQAQALACGLPVIATPNTGCEDLFTHEVEGLIIPAQSSEAICDAITWIADHPQERQRMSEASQKRVQGLSGWRGYADRIVEIATEAITKRNQ